MFRHSDLFVPALIATLMLGVPASVHGADDGSELMKAQSSGGQGSDPEKVRQLRELLHQAERDQAARRRVAADAAVAGPAAPEAAAGNPAVGAAASDPKNEQSGTSAKAGAPAETPSSPSAPTAEGEEGEEGEVTALPPPPAPVARPGCMYSGTTLIWERAPGTCH